jgi:hypothetical protein
MGHTHNNADGGHDRWRFDIQASSSAALGEFIRTPVNQ